MTIENQKTDLEYLSCTWHEKVKNIRVRARRCKKNNIEEAPEAIASENTTETPSDNELFAGPVHEELSAQQLFVGNEDFYKSLESAQPTGTPQSFDVGQVSTAQIGYKRFSSVQKALAAAIILIAAVLLHAILKPPSEPTSQMISADRQTPATEPQTAETVRTTPQQAKKPEPILDPTQPLSLKIAQTFYLNGDYDQALVIYEKLHKNLPASPKEDLMRDFLQLQMALCMERTADYVQAGRLLRKILKSNSPVVRVVAYYHCSLLEMQKKQYLNARTKAYQAIALIDAIDFDKNWALSLKRDGYFLAAQAITRKALSLCDADKDLPKDLWGILGTADEPFVELNETQLRTFLNSGSEQLRQAVLAPQIRQLGHQGGLARYDITCNGAPVEELLARFAANSAIDLHWGLDTEKKGIRKRLVYLYLPLATTPQFVTAAAGCTGLLARIDEKGVVNILNPARYSYVAEHISFLSEEAVSLWQNFLLRFPEDVRLANVHFALGLLHASKGRPAEAIAEYKLVANRFSNSYLAPFALLNSSKLKNSLHDYADGREDLKQLVEQFPDTEIAGKAYLYLADTTAKADLKTEAERLYRKVYNLSLSSESQSAAAFGAGECSLHIGDHESAVKWLTRYIKLTKESKDLCSAYFLLGKAYLALENSEAACNAFQHALQGGPERLGREEYIETISAMVEAYMQQGHFVQALDILEDIHSAALSQKEFIEILLLKSKVLRVMGLVDKAIAIIGDRAEYVSDTQLKTKICFELSDCYIEKGRLDVAHKKLAEILVLTESGPLAHEIALRLAEVCLQLGQNNQTISVCSQLLNLQPSEQIKQKTLDLMAMAYKQQKNYDRAALALLGQWN
jgi:tetratricopeptide (TPR) repeat protein